MKENLDLVERRDNLLDAARHFSRCLNMAANCDCLISSDGGGIGSSFVGDCAFAIAFILDEAVSVVEQIGNGGDDD